MKLQEIFNQLTHGEFSQLSIGGNERGVITDKTYPAVLSHINLGLTALFTRFSLMEGRIDLRPVPGQLVYHLDSKFSVNYRHPYEAVRYLIDTPKDVFNDDTVIKVEKVLDSEGNLHNLNVDGDPNSFFTPSIKSLRIPKDWKGDVTLVYRKNHPQVVVPMTGLLLPERVEIELPYTHLEALLYFVASRAHNPAGMSNEFHMGASYAAKYEQACMMLDMQNVQSDRTTENHRLIRGGWV
jgi:hypothetical protein